MTLPPPLSLKKLRHDQCHYPVDNEDLGKKARLFCAAPIEPGGQGPWCAEHRRIVYVRSAPAPREYRAGEGRR